MKLPRQLNRFIAVSLAGVGALAQAGPQVGVSVSVHEPGFYGRVEIGQQPPPRVVYAQPVVIQQTPVAVVQRPIYLRVPPQHYQHWGRYCGRYSACGQPVYFVDAAPVVVRERAPKHWREDKRGRGHDRDDRHHGKGRSHGHHHD